MDPALCPLCGNMNRCGIEQGESNCWCFSLDFSADLLATIPEAAQGKICICQSCAAKAEKDP